MATAFNPPTPLFPVPSVRFCPIKPATPTCVLAPRKPVKSAPAHSSSKFPPVVPRRIPINVGPVHSISTRTREQQVEKAYQLASSRGALGRGVRACLRAFYRRASFIVASAHINSGPLYVEIGPAYVLKTAKMGWKREKVTRYAVEQKAWPALRELFGWEETSAYDARKRGSVLRHLSAGGRFGRHLFVGYEELAAIVAVAEELVEAVEERTERGIKGAELYKGLGEGAVGVGGMGGWQLGTVEGVVELKRRPLAGGRTVSARCLRSGAHRNGDRKPSLILWMNSDGITGGGMCPVCLEEGGERHMTWRVHYLPEGDAVLCTPWRRIRSPARVERVVEEYKRLISEQTGRDEIRKGMVGVGEVAGVSGKEIAMARIEKEGEGGGDFAVASGKGEPIGGCVILDRSQIGKVGEVIGMAYVTASLRIALDLNTTAEDLSDGNRQRTVGTMVRQRCPMQVLLWSERRSKGPVSSRRVEEVAWFAQQSVTWGAEDGGEVGGGGEVEEVVDSEEWLPTPLLSVSAMKPTSWRDVTATNGRLISVPASWEPSAQAWVLFDIDDIELGEDAAVTEAGNKMSLVVRREQELSGRCLVIRTGPAGMHVWAELREVRGDPVTWFKKEVTKKWYAGLGSRLLNAAHRADAVGGTIDMSSCAAGRFARRPGWRLLADGTQFRSHVALYVPSRVRSRTPRIPHRDR